MLKINWLGLKILLGFVVVMTSFFAMSGVVFSSRETIATTKIGTAIDNDNEKIIFKSANYYEKSQLLEVEVFYEGTLKDATAKLEMGAYNPITKEKLKLETESINLNYYVIFIPNVAELKQIVLGFRTSDLEGVTSDDVPVIHLTSKNTTSRGKFVKRSVSAYEQNYVKDLIAVSAIQLKTIKKEIKTLVKQIPTYRDAQDKLKAQLAYQTSDEQISTQEKIKAHETTIATLNQNIHDKEVEGEKIQEKINLLKNKGK
jgi:hypothetical protein